MDYSTYDAARYVPSLEEAIAQGNRSIDVISQYINISDKTQSILEIGCASGTLLKALAMKGFVTLKGVDVSPILADHGRTELGVDIYVSDWMSYVRDCASKFDIIIALDVLEHLRPEEVEKTLTLTRQRLSSKGKLLLRIPNPSCPFVLPTFYGDLSHRLLITAELLESLLRSSGFNGPIIFEETRPYNLLKRILYSIAHICVVKPLISLLHYHFYGKVPLVITRNIYCCASVERE